MKCPKCSDELVWIDENTDEWCDCGNEQKVVSYYRCPKCNINVDVLYGCTKEVTE